MELCDVVDESGVRTGRTVTRGTELGSGEYFPVVHVWIRDEFGNYLIQQRAPHLAYSPGIWATTVGYMLAGEDSLAAAIRETREEVGIRLSPAQLRRFDRISVADLVADLWLAEVTRDEIGTPALGPEVAAWMWSSKAELELRIKQGKFFEYIYFNDLPG